MQRTLFGGILLLVVATVIVALAPTIAAAREPFCPHVQASPDLFYNYYVPPGPAGGVPSQMYLSPHPTPPLVGHTWITYQPLMPHEFLYKHARNYYR